MNNISTLNKNLNYMALSKPIVRFEVVEGRGSAGAVSLSAQPNDIADAGIDPGLLDDPTARDEMG